MHAMNMRIAVALSLALLGFPAVPAAADSASTREACNKWLETGVQPQGLTRDDCHFANDKPYGSILSSGTSDVTRIWREQADHQKRFVLDTGSEQKQSPQ
jgi:hypothetical protein